MNPKCPACKSANTIPIACGMPSEKIARTVQKRGDMKLGGPYAAFENWHCRECDFEGPRELADRRISEILNEINSSID